jgi:hypothetical protein
MSLYFQLATETRFYNKILLVLSSEFLEAIKKKFSLKLTLQVGTQLPKKICTGIAIEGTKRVSHTTLTNLSFTLVAYRNIKSVFEEGLLTYRCVKCSKLFKSITN